MKTFPLFFTLFLTALNLSAQPHPQTQPQGKTQPFRLDPIASITIPVTLDKMTNLIFPESIQSGVKVSAEILAQKVHGVENVIEIKALRRRFTTTNLSVYGKDGQLYSFVLKYVDDTDVLNFRVLPAAATAAPPASATASLPAEASPIQLSDLPSNTPTLRADAKKLEARRPRLHTKARTDHLTLHLTGAYAKDSLEWLTFKIANQSALDFQPETARFYLQDRKQVRRRAIQEVDIHPVYQDLPLDIPRAARPTFAIAFNPFHISKGKRLVCEFKGRDGRLLVLEIKSRTLAAHLHKFVTF